MTQHDFLHGMGIGTRAEVLGKGVDFGQANALKTQVHTLTDPSKMGHRFKFMAATSVEGAAVPVFEG